MKFKGYALLLAISVKADEMENRKVFREVFP